MQQDIVGVLILLRSSCQPLYNTNLIFISVPFRRYEDRYNQLVYRYNLALYKEIDTNGSFFLDVNTMILSSDMTERGSFLNRTGKERVMHCVANIVRCPMVERSQCGNITYSNLIYITPAEVDPLAGGGSFADDESCASAGEASPDRMPMDLNATFRFTTLQDVEI